MDGSLAAGVSSRRPLIAHSKLGRYCKHRVCPVLPSPEAYIVIKVAVVGLGKMGLSHYAVVNAHPDVEVAGICDSSSYVLGVLKKYTGVTTYSDFDAMLDKADLDAVVIATPSSSHAKMVRAALERDLHVFCEKPFTLNPQDAEALAALSDERGLVTQVGYHNRFIGAFQRGQAAARRRSDRRGDPCSGRGIRPRRAEAKGRNLAQPAHRGRWMPVRLRRARPRPRQLVRRRAGGRRRYGAEQRVLARDRRRGLQHPLLPPGNDGPDLRQLVRRVLPQDDDPHHRLGHEGTDLRRPAGMPGVYPGHRDASRWVRARLERALHHRADRAGVVLPARRGVQRPDRRFRPAREGAAHGRHESLRERGSDRQDHRHADRGRREGRLDARRRRRHSSPCARSGQNDSASGGDDLEGT